MLHDFFHRGRRRNIAKTHNPYHVHLISSHTGDIVLNNSARSNSNYLKQIVRMLFSHYTSSKNLITKHGNNTSRNVDFIIASRADNSVQNGSVATKICTQIQVLFTANLRMTSFPAFPLAINSTSPSTSSLSSSAPP